MVTSRADKRIAFQKQLELLKDLREQYFLGEIGIEIDDPRTYQYQGLSEQEALFVIGEATFCVECGFDCICDDEFEQLKERGY